MSIADCLKKHGIDAKHEDVILKGFAQAVDDGQLDDHVEATNALQEALIDAENERADIMAQIEAQTPAAAETADVRFSRNPLRRWMPVPRKPGWTEEKILRALKSRVWNKASGKSTVLKAIAEFDSAEEFADHIYYHGTGSYVSNSLVPSITMSEAEAERSGGGGYGERYWAVSLSKSKELASNFTAQSDYGTVYGVILRKGANVRTIPGIEDAAEIEDHVVQLWNDGVDAVDIGGGEQELAVLNPAAIVRYENGESFGVFKKKKFEPLTTEQIEDIYAKSKEFAAKLSETELKERKNLEVPEVNFSKAEIDRTLIAQHNLSVRNLIHADRMGALAAPSIAITDKAHPLTGFGEITLLADEDFVNGARTFGADIYSTRYPEVSYDFSIKDIKKLNDQFEDERSRLGDREFYASNMDDPNRILKESPAVAMKFLESEGIKPKIKLIKPDEKPATNMLKWVKSPLDRQELTRDSKFIEDVKKDYVAQFKDVPADELKEILPENDDQWRNVATRQAFKVTNYRESLKNKGKVDLDGTQRALTEQIRLFKRMDKFNAYIDSVITGINPKQEIFDKFTNTGSGRKYIEHNLDNVIRKMRSNFVGGESFGFGLGRIRGVHAPEFKSIEHIRKNKNRLMNEKEFDAVKEDVNKELTDLVEKVNQYGTYTGYDNVEQAIFDSAKMGISRALTYNGFKNVPDDVKLEIEQFISKLRNMPTEYFEAKVLRGVGIGEFKAAVVPKDIAPEALAILKKNGITDIRMYKPGSSEDRFKQINSVKHVMFSRAPKLYSKLEQALEAANDKVFSTGPQVKMWLQSNAGKLGIKKDEIYWSGIDNWLDAQGKVNKQQVVEFVRNNGVKVEDVTLGEAIIPKRADAIHDQYKDLVDKRHDLKTQYDEGTITLEQFRVENRDITAKLDEFDQELNAINSDVQKTLPKHNNDKLTLPGGTDYKELVVTVPTIEKYNESDSTHFGDTGQGKQIGWIRMDTRDGGLFIEELQSQRAQQGRSKGFGPRNVTRYEVLLNGKYWGDFNTKLEADSAVKSASTAAGDFEINEVVTGRLRGVPPAPFVSDANNKATNAYITLLMKKALIEAVSNDHASVSWATGDQQADRYDLSKQISRITYSKRDGKFTYNAFGMGGDNLVGMKMGATADVVRDNLGKEILDKMVNDEGRKTKHGMELSGLDLKVGGEWAQSMYGNEQGLNAQGEPSLMSQAANDIFKHVGSGKVESINGQPGFYVTPEMKAKDLPLFSRSTVTVDGVERPTTNSEGNRIHPTDEGLRNFWRWFGDSEVVDKQGRPLVVYHGTNYDISTFDKSKLGENTLGHASDESYAATSLIGFWFNNEPMAEKAKSTYTVDMPVYIKAESVRDEGSLGNLSQSVGEYLSGDLIEDYDNDLFYYAENAASDYVDRLERNGYDGVKIADEEFGGISYAVFNPNQIKSAIGNNGDYSLTNSDIRFSFAGPKAETVTVDGIERPTTNSEGEPIYNPVNFWRWFGDSKVVDKQGRPLVVYHGSPKAGFSTFDEYEIGSNTANASHGFYFTENRRNASTYSGTMTEADFYDQSEHPDYWDVKEGVYSVYLKITDPYEMDFNGRDWTGAIEGEYDGHESVPEIENTAKQIGMDGAIITNVSDEGGFGQGYNWGEVTYIAFNPNQIKSAIGNNGDYSSTNNDIRFSFAGPKAETADKYALDTAQQRMAAGEDADTVRQDTGWFKGVDDKWRFEINDSDASIKKPFPTKGQRFGDVYKSVYESKLKGGYAGIALGDVIAHPKLFAAYPRLADLSIDTQKGDGASYRVSTSLSPSMIQIGEDVPMSEVLSVLLHEVQHGIQKIERFANGGSLESARKAAADIVTTKLKKINERIIDLGTNRSALKGDEYLKNVELHKTLVKERDALNDELEGLKYDMAPAADAYKRLAGEVEARNTQLRMGMSEAERAASSPKDTQDVPDSDQIIVYNGVEMRSEPIPTITVDGIERPTENSEGKSIYNPVNFWRWFGDSKVVDKQGRPLVVYRGDSPDKNEFTGKGKGIRLPGNIFFTDNKSIGNSYAKDRELYSVYLKVIDPYTVDAKHESWLEIPAPMEIKEEWGNPDKTIQIDELAAWSRNKGSDGLIVKNVMDQYGDGTQYVVFNPNQIKSATGNNGDYSSTNNDIRFSKEPERLGLVGARKENVQTPPTETRFRKFQRMNQDSFNRFTVIREWLEKNGQKLSDMADVYGAEERYHSKVANQLEDFREQQRNPLIEKIQKAGYTLGDVEVFLKMQHTQEANAQNRKITGNPDAMAAGITDEEAAEYLAEAPKELATLANELRDITEQTKQLRLDAGILNTDITDGWEGAYKYYIPMKGEADAERGTGKGLTVNFKSKRRLGHGLRDEHVIENIFMDHERAIMEVEKNRVGKSLVMMGAEMQRPDIISIAEPEKRKVLKTDTAYVVEANGVVQGVFVTQGEANIFKQLYAASMPNVAPSAIVISQTKDQRVIATASPMLADNEVNVYMNGHAIRVQINDELLARAYTKLGVEQFTGILAAGRILNGYLSKVYTGYNPEFILTNMVRDFTAGIINLTGEEGFTMATKALVNYPKMFSDLLKYAASNGKSSTKLIDSYRANGGNTGAAYLSDMERLGNEVATEYAAYQGVMANLKQGDTMNAARAAGKKLFKYTLKWIYNLNQAGENAMRLAAYKAMLDSGRTVNEAAKVAKNITVNFNRKGERKWTPALYLFFNATVQGTAAVSHALLKGKHKYQAQALAAGMAAVGYMVGAALGGGDEDDWEKIHEYTKERNVLIKSDDGYAKIPLPYGHGFFYNLGRHIAEAQRTGEWGVVPWHLATSAISEFTPLNDTIAGSDTQFESDQVFMGLLPTALKIPAQPIFNKQLSTGSEVMPDSEFDKSQPEREMMWRGTKGTMYDKVAGWLEAAGFDVSPETLKYITRTFTGGTGALVDTAISSAMLKKEGATLDAAEIPFVRKGYMELGVKDARAAFHKAAGEARTAAETFNRIKRKNDLEKLDTFLADGQNLELLALDNYADKLRKWTAAERDIQDALRADESISVKEKRLKLKELEKQETQYYDDYLDLFKASKLQMR